MFHDFGILEAFGAVVEHPMMSVGRMDLIQVLCFWCEEHIRGVCACLSHHNRRP